MFYNESEKYDGAFDYLNIKVGSNFLNLSPMNVKSEEEFKCLNEYKNEIIKIIKRI